MTRLALAATAAALLLAGTPRPAAANGPYGANLRCGGVCLRMFPFIHQHGPLYNYGPYYGYPPFEPYGPWDAYLRYTGPDHRHPGPGAYGWVHGWQPWERLHAVGDRLHNRDGLLHHKTGGKDGGLFHHKGGGHHGDKGGCQSCGAAAANYLTAGDPLARYSGYGHPQASAAFYADSALPARAGVVPAGFFGN